MAVLSRSVYTPAVLSGRQFLFTPQTQATVSRAERMLVRLEDRAQNCDVRMALHSILTRLEAISSVRIEGKRPELCSILKAESLLDFGEDDELHRLHRLDLFDFSNEEERLTTFDVLHFEVAAERIYRTEGWESAVTPQTLIDIHSLSRCGKTAARSGIRPRNKPFYLEDISDQCPYIPPCPHEIALLLDDLCNFINQDLYSPITQTAVAHFQFESIKPFKSGLDKSGRLLSHAVIHRRGLMRHLIAPIGLEPAIDTKAHAHLLLPYRFSSSFGQEELIKAVDRWTDFCAYSAEVSVRVADIFLNAILELRDSWIERFGRPNKGSALEALINLLVGHPVLTVRQAANLIGKSVSAVNDALLKLESAGIVSSGEGLRREGIYSAVEAVDVLERLERELMPHAPVARNSVSSNLG